MKLQAWPKKGGVNREFQIKQRPPDPPPIPTRTVRAVLLDVCEKGHARVLGAIGDKQQLRHSCGAWTWSDGNFCTGCGAALRT